MSSCCPAPDDTPSCTQPFADIHDELPDGAPEVRTAGFDQLRRGLVPSAEDIAGNGLDVETVRRVLEVMVDWGAAELDGDGRVVAIGGLSVVATRHELLLDGVAVHTWCAVDALGIPAALGVDAIARTRCEHCGGPIEVAFNAGAPSDGNPVATWFPQTRSGNLRQNFCDAANAFCNQDHLDVWHRANGSPDGDALALDEVIERGRVMWEAEARAAASVTGANLETT